MCRLPSRAFVILAILMTSAVCHGADAWLYQLQNPSPAEMAKAGFGTVIMDYSADGSGEGEFSREEIEGLRATGIRPISYLSIGEAEDYRFYWKKVWATERPAWLGRENPEWKGNFEVRYWDKDWREGVLKPYLEKITAAGFAGVYLDIVDGFEYWGDEDSFKAGREVRRTGDPADEAEAAMRMVELVEWIKRTGTELNQGRPFLVIAQNGERLMAFKDSKRFLAAISGLGVEGLWYERKKRLPARRTDGRLAWLRQAQAAGKTVVVTDYVDDGKGMAGENGARVREFLALCGKEGFDHYVARVNQQLDVINRIEGVQP